MVAYSIFLNFVEVFTLTTFVYLYYSLSNKKTFVLLFCCLLFGFEICDILKENGIVLMSFNFIVFNNLYFSWNYIKNHTYSLYLLVNKTS